MKTLIIAAIAALGLASASVASASVACQSHLKLADYLKPGNNPDQSMYPNALAEFMTANENAKTCVVPVSTSWRPSLATPSGSKVTPIEYIVRTIDHLEPPPYDHHLAGIVSLRVAGFALGNGSVKMVKASASSADEVLTALGQLSKPLPLCADASSGETCIVSSVVRHSSETMPGFETFAFESGTHRGVVQAKRLAGETATLSIDCEDCSKPKLSPGGKSLAASSIDRPSFRRGVALDTLDKSESTEPVFDCQRGGAFIPTKRFDGDSAEVLSGSAGFDGISCDILADRSFTYRLTITKTK